VEAVAGRAGGGKGIVVEALGGGVVVEAVAVAIVTYNLILLLLL
jgi:hypothetical protein